MADYIACDNKVDLNSLFLSLFSLNAAGHFVFRLDEEAAGDESPLTCDTKDEFWTLFRRAISLADDGKPALRVIITDVANGVTLQDLPCASGLKWQDAARSAFRITAAGEVAFNIVNIT